MSFDRASRIADAVLLEGYALYPYRASSTKNRYRWTFGVVAPRAWSEAQGSEPWRRQVDCLLLGERPALRGRLRFLQVQARQVEAAQDGAFRPVDSLEAGGKTHLTWEEGLTREIDFELAGDAHAVDLVWKVEGGEELELLVQDGNVAGKVLRRRRALEGTVRASLCRLGTLLRLTVHVENHTAADPTESRAAIMSSSCVSAHLLLAVEGGEFVSTVDPPELAAEASRDCRCDGLYPALVGERGRRDLLLCAPIILQDFPEIAPESPGDLFDATEIDEILTLRTLSLTPDEKREARALDPRTAALLDRVEALTPDELARLHGALREDGRAVAFQAGNRVRLRPGARRTDAQDLLFSGRVATVEAVLTDIAGQTLLAVTVDDDPAAELHRWYGRYQYYYVDEVEALETGGA